MPQADPRRAARSGGSRVVALGILLAAVAAVVVSVGERLYRRSLLQTRGRVSLRQAWSAPEEGADAGPGLTGTGACE